MVIGRKIREHLRAASPFVAAAILVILTACSSDTGELNVESASDTASTVVSTTAPSTPTTETTGGETATTETPATIAPSTTAAPEEEPEEPSVVIETDVVFGEGYSATGTFVVTTGDDLLGCSSGTTVEDIGRDGYDQTFTCDDGSREGTFTLRFNPTSRQGSDWELVASTGDWETATGSGRWIGVASDDGTSAEAVYTGAVAFGEVTPPIETVPRLVQFRDQFCGEGYGSFDGRAEFATRDDILVRLDISTGEVTEHGPVPARCAYWIGDEGSGRRIATSEDAKTFWFGPFDGEWETEITFDTKPNLVSRSVEANRILIRDWNDMLVLDATTGEQIGDRIVGSFATGRMFSAHAVSPDESLIVIGDGGTDGGRVIVVDAESGEELFEIDTPAPVTALKFDETREALTAGLFTGEVLTIDLEDREIVSTVAISAPETIVAIGTRPDGLVVAATLEFAELVDPVSGPTGPSVTIRNSAGSTIRPDGLISSLSTSQEWNTYEIVG